MKPETLTKCRRCCYANLFGTFRNWPCSIQGMLSSPEIDCIPNLGSTPLGDEATRFSNSLCCLGSHHRSRSSSLEYGVPGQTVAVWHVWIWYCSPCSQCDFLVEFDSFASRKQSLPQSKISFSFHRTASCIAQAFLDQSCFVCVTFRHRGRSHCVLRGFQRYRRKRVGLAEQFAGQLAESLLV